MKNTIIILKDINDNDEGFPIVHMRETRSVEIVETDEERMVIFGFDGGPIPGPIGISRDFVQTIRDNPSSN